ncbi:hypothetical protein FRB94_003391 [Tulasnella sp. JGI-2019a]|nr:hypothetical protein FRB93_004132 [Tulasnella sp. JGI-2019a]KAG9003078.1 hypothetical protein FRB94_003391 [Tulasnella sp. JGI-2019a]KAG9035071.1 hypothetical protein FRB95_012090 [Tulasnella sp. JGI-2019a]
MLLPCFLYVLTIVNEGIACTIDIIYDNNPHGHSAVTWLYNLTAELSLVITVFINILVTALIAGKIWWIKRLVRRIAAPEDDSDSYTAVILIVVESGLLCTLAQAAYLVAFASRSTAATSIIACLTPKVIALAPTLILLQINLGYLQPGDSYHTRNQTCVETDNGLPITSPPSSTTATTEFMASWTREPLQHSRLTSEPPSSLLTCVEDQRPKRQHI